MWPVIAGGAFTLAGVLLGHFLGSRGEAQRLAAEDDRRWLNDRRAVFGRFLRTCEDLLRAVDRVAVVHLSYDGTHELTSEEKADLRTDLYEYFSRWDDEMQPLLSEVQLMAGPEVADLADRTSGALMEITGVIETEGAFTEYYPGWFQARDLAHVLRNAMRRELQLPKIDFGPQVRDDGWPWLTARPSRSVSR